MPNQSHITILHQYLSITPVTNSCVSHNDNTISIQIMVQNSKIKPLALLLTLFSKSYVPKSLMFTFFLKYDIIECIYVV
jgi:hypothetical protein